MIKLAIDLGSTETKIYRFGSGLVLAEPSVVAIDNEGGKADIKAIGIEAHKLIGLTSQNVDIVYPIKHGEIVDEEIAAYMLKHFLKKVDAVKTFLRTDVLFTLPCGYEQKDKMKLISIAKSAGVNNVYVAESPICSALSCTPPPSEAHTPYFIVDMGGEVTNFAVVNLSGIICGFSVSYGGKDLNAEIAKELEENLNVKFGTQTVENIKREIGTLAVEENMKSSYFGRNSLGVPSIEKVQSNDFYKSLEKYYDSVVSAIYDVYKKLPPEVSAMVGESGIYFMGGGAKIYGLKEYLEKKLNYKINLLKDPEFANVLGAGKLFASVYMKDWANT